MEDNGRYACTCGTGRTFVSEDFCGLSPENQDLAAECVGDGYCLDSSDCSEDESCDEESRCVGEGEGESR